MVHKRIKAFVLSVCLVVVADSYNMCTFTKGSSPLGFVLVDCLCCLTLHKEMPKSGILHKRVLDAFIQDLPSCCIYRFWLFVERE